MHPYCNHIPIEQRIRTQYLVGSNRKLKHLTMSNLSDVVELWVVCEEALPMVKVHVRIIFRPYQFPVAEVFVLTFPETRIATPIPTHLSP